MQPTIDDLLKKITADLAQASLLIENLRSIGYCYTFEQAGSRLVCIETRQCFAVIDLYVDEIYRLEKFVDGIDDYFIYTLRAKDNSAMGIFTAFPIDAVHINASV